MLTAPILDADRVVLIASKGGDHRNPEWYLNLVANPDVEVKLIGTGEVRRLRARVASPEEKESLWPTIVASYKGYAATRSAPGATSRWSSAKRGPTPPDPGRGPGIPHEVLPDS